MSALDVDWHPSEEALVAMASGTPPDAALEEHLDQCDTCRRGLAACLTAAPGPSSVGRLLPEGARLGRYVVGAPLGSGGMGLVYAAEDPALQRKVALKRLRQGLDAEGQLLLREARAMARLSHPNVVPVFDVLETDDGPYLAMELVEGGTLRGWLQTKRRRGEIVEMFRQAGRGLAAAHQAGIVHRDFKPENVLVSQGRALVTDFGLAQPAPETGQATPTGAFPGGGTLAYMAPEQWKGGLATPRSDQYSFCVALFEALYGRRPIEVSGIEEAQRLVAIRGAPPIPRRGAPMAARAVLERGLQADPSKRFEDMDALLARLSSRRALAYAAVVSLFLVALVAFSFSRWSATRVVDLTIQQGHQVVIDAKGAQRFAIGDPNLVDLHVLGDTPQLVLIGTAPGKTNLLVWLPDGRREYEVTVTP